MGNREGRPSKVADVNDPGNVPKLKKADMEFLKANTSFDEETISEWYTEFLRDCKNGKLSPKKFMEVYQVMCPGGEAQAFAKHAFRTFDKDRNGFIDFKKWAALDKPQFEYPILVKPGAMKSGLRRKKKSKDLEGPKQRPVREFLMAVNVTSSGSVEQKLKWAFSMVDIDGNGTIDLQEMTKVISAIQEMSSALAATKAKTDSANPVLKEASTIDPSERAKQIFQQMDINRDGILEEREFVAGCMNDPSLVQMLLISGSLAPG